MLTGLLGGALIGVAATLYWLATGRTAGVSGIVAGALGDREARSERIAFLAGLIGVGLLAALVSSPATATPRPLPILLIAGVLVGFGTRLGRGCTSGHGVCGLSRFSVRSLIATATFIAAGAATVAVVNHLHRLPGAAS
jgi:uncharacterized protein